MNYNERSQKEIKPKIVQTNYTCFFVDIDERRRYTKKVHPLKAWVGPSIVKRRKREDFMGWVGVEGICGCGS